MDGARLAEIGRSSTTRFSILVLTAQKGRTDNMSNDNWDMAGGALICVLFLLFAMVVLR